MFILNATLQMAFTCSHIIYKLKFKLNFKAKNQIQTVTILSYRKNKK